MGLWSVRIFIAWEFISSPFLKINFLHLMSMRAWQEGKFLLLLLLSCSRSCSCFCSCSLLCPLPLTCVQAVASSEQHYTITSSGEFPEYTYATLNFACFFACVQAPMCPLLFCTCVQVVARSVCSVIRWVYPSLSSLNHIVPSLSCSCSCLLPIQVARVLILNLCLCLVDWHNDNMGVNPCLIQYESKPIP
jgi:hypothetical protein